MPATTTNLLTWEAFEQLPGGATHKEILEGELIVLPPPKCGHRNIAGNAYDRLMPFVKEHRLGRVYLEAGYLLSRDPATWVQPDVSFLSLPRLLQTTPDGYFSGAPELSIEVVSPSESAVDIERKIDLMLAAGCSAVWAIYPKSRHVWVYSPGASQLFAEADVLTAPEILPGFALPVSALFENWNHPLAAQLSQLPQRSPVSSPK